MENSPASIEIPDTLPVMALSDCTLFPHCLLPLFIFESRYREMINHVLENDRIFCIGTVRPGMDPDGPEAESAIHTISTAGMIRACVGQPDGTSHLILQGLRRIQITGWEQTEPFRIAKVETFEEQPSPSMAAEDPEPAEDPALLAADLLDLTTTRGPLSSALAEQLNEIEDPATTADVIAYNLVREPRLKQQILEMPQLLSRLRTLLAYCSERIDESEEN
jgi:ATP-dependent Lon protease